MRSSDTLAAISPALVAAINAIEGVKKGANNPAFKGTKYATLEAVIEASHEHLAANKLAILQGPGMMQGNALTVTTRLIHESGEWIETDFAIPLAKQDPQAAGSAITYARRYSLMAMLNMPAVDDDGEQAMGRGTQVATITEAQAQELKALAVSVGADVPKFLAYMRVPTIEAIPATSFHPAKAALEAKRQKEAA